MARFSPRSKVRSVPRLEPRIAALTALIAVVLGIAAVRLYYLQVIRHHDLSEMAERNRIRIQRLPALRGLVYDDRHRPLVDTRPSFDAVVVPEDSPNLSATIERLEKLLGQDNVAKKLEDADDQGRPEFEPVAVEERLLQDLEANEHGVTLNAASDPLLAELWDNPRDARYDKA